MSTRIISVREIQGMKPKMVSELSSSHWLKRVFCSKECLLRAWKFQTSFHQTFFLNSSKLPTKVSPFSIRNSSTDHRSTAGLQGTALLRPCLGLNQVQDVLFEADISAMYADADAVVQIVKALTLRAAALISTALAGVIKAIANEKHSYAISGTHFRWHK